MTVGVRGTVVHHAEWSIGLAEDLTAGHCCSVSVDGDRRVARDDETDYGLRFGRDQKRGKVSVLSAEAKGVALVQSLFTAILFQHVKFDGNKNSENSA